MGKVPDSGEMKFVQLTHTVWTKINDNEWIYYTPGTDSKTVSCADRDPVDIPLKGAVKLFLTQPVRVRARPHYCSLCALSLQTVRNNKETQLIQVAQ